MGIDELVFVGIACGLLFGWICYIGWIAAMFIKERLDSRREIRTRAREIELTRELFGVFEDIDYDF